MTDISKDAVEAMADELDAEVFARCGIKAKEAAVLRAQSARIAELEAALNDAADSLDDYSAFTGNTIETPSGKAARAALIPSKPTPEPTAAMFGMGGDNDDFDT